MKDLEKEVNKGNKLKEVDERPYLERIDSRKKINNQCSGYPSRRSIILNQRFFSYKRSN